MRPLGASDPTVIAAYRLLGVLGGGGMGRVYLGQSPSGRRVAIKVIRAGLAEDPVFRERFAREVAAVRTVNPLFTAAVVDADTEAETPWLASVYIDGPSLEQHIEAYGPLAPNAVFTLAAGLAEALASIHHLGLIHRDLKPSNVLLDDSGPHIIDFGIALASDDPRITTSLVVGTPSYMAPERIHSSEVGPAGDVFSLGATLAYAATGKNLVSDGNMYSQIVQITMGHFDLSKVPRELRPIIVRCTSHQKNDRPTADELTRILVAAGVHMPAPGWYHAGRDGAGRLPPTVTLPPAPSARHTRRRVLALGGVLGAAVAGGAVLVATGALGRRSDNSPGQGLSPASSTPSGPGTILWTAQLDPQPLVPTLADATAIPIIANRDGRIISRSATDVFAQDRSGQPLWTQQLSTGLLDLRPWGHSLLVADPDQVWLLDPDNGGNRFPPKRVADAERAVAQSDNSDGMPVKVHGLALATDYTYLNLGTAIVAIDRSGTTVWRTIRPPALNGHRPQMGNPQAANGEWMVTHDTGDGTAQAALYDASNGAAQWPTRYSLAAPTQTGGGPGGPPQSDLWQRSEARIAGDYVVLRDGGQIHVLHTTDASEAWTMTSPRPVSAIEVFGDLLLICADKLTAHSLATGDAQWELQLRGAQVAIYLDGPTIDQHSAIVASEQTVCALSRSGYVRWHVDLSSQGARLNSQSIMIDDRAAFVTFTPGQDQGPPAATGPQNITVMAFELAN